MEGIGCPSPRNQGNETAGANPAVLLLALLRPSRQLIVMAFVLVLFDSLVSRIELPSSATATML